MIKVANARVENGFVVVTLESDSREELVDPAALRVAVEEAAKLGFHGCAIGMNTKGPYPVDAETKTPITMPEANVKIAFRRDIHCVFRTSPF